VSEAALPVSSVSDLYARAPSLGISEGQAHWLAELLLHVPGTTLRVDGALLELSLPDRAPICCVTMTVPALMPFGAGATDLE
jgi:hypothetical protein